MANYPTKSQLVITNSIGKELVNHGTPLFPIAFYHDNLKRERVPWHWHDEMEAGYIESGETVVSAGRMHYTLRQGQGFFINADVIHAVHGVHCSQCRYRSLVFHPRLIGGDVDSVFWQSYLRPLTGSGLRSLALDGGEPWHERALACLKKAWEEGDQEAPGYEFRVRASVSEFIFLLCQHLPPEKAVVSEKTLRDSGRIKTMLRFIQQNYREAISVSDIAGSAALSESECLRCFNGTIGVPPIQYVKRFRVQKAAQMLIGTNLKIADIGEKCGFLDISYFTRSFREIKGMSPGEYRRQAQAR